MKDTWTLTLKNVQTGDRGPYMCQVRLFAEFWVLIWFPNFFYWVTKNCLFLLMIISTGELDACEKSSGPFGGLWKLLFWFWIFSFWFLYFLKRLLKTNDTFQVVIPPTIEDTESSQDQANINQLFLFCLFVYQMSANYFI